MIRRPTPDDYAACIGRRRRVSLSPMAAPVMMRFAGEVAFGAVLQLAHPSSHPPERAAANRGALRPGPCSLLGVRALVSRAGAGVLLLRVAHLLFGNAPVHPFELVGGLASRRLRPPVVSPPVGSGAITGGTEEEPGRLQVLYRSGRAEGSAGLWHGRGLRLPTGLESD